MCRLAGRAIPSPCRVGPSNKVRLIAEGPDFQGVLDAAFNQIRQYGCTSAAVMIHLLEAIDQIARCSQTDDQRPALHRQAQMIQEMGQSQIRERQDRQDLTSRYQSVLESLREKEMPRVE